METLLLLLLGLFDFIQKFRLLLNAVHLHLALWNWMMTTLQHKAGLDVWRWRSRVREDVVKRAASRNGDKFTPTKTLCHFLRVLFIVIDRNTFLTFLLLQQHYTEYNIQRPGLKFQLKTSVVCVANFNEQQGKGSITETSH